MSFTFVDSARCPECDARITDDVGALATAAYDSFLFRPGSEPRLLPTGDVSPLVRGTSRTWDTETELRAQL